jgi:hypothetical protein
VDGETVIFNLLLVNLEKERPLQQLSGVRRELVLFSQVHKGPYTDIE